MNSSIDRGLPFPAVAVAAAVVATLVYWTTLSIGYSQDDWFVLDSVLNNPGLARLPLPLWRPLEDGIAWISVFSGLRIYKVIELLGLGLLAALTGSLAESLWRSRLAGMAAAAMTVLAPLNTISVYEVDTVSQVLAGLAGVLILKLYWGSADNAPPRRQTVLLALVLVFALGSKETAFGVALVPILLWLVKASGHDCGHDFGVDAGKPHRRFAIVAALLVLTSLAIRFAMIRGGMFSGGDAKYTFSLTPLTWLKNFAMLIGGNFIAAPSSRLLGNRAAMGGLDWTALALSGTVAVLIGGFLLARLAAPDSQTKRGLLLVLLFWVASQFPATIYHGSEIYVFQGLPFLAILIGGAVATGMRKPGLLRVATVLLALGFGLASVRATQINARTLLNMYRHSEYLRCEKGLSSDCRDAAERAQRLAGSGCMLSGDALATLNGSSTKPYSLYYSDSDEVAGYLAPPGPDIKQDARTLLPSCS